MKEDIKTTPIVLTIAGSDPSAGAGIQQDLKTITMLRCYGATVITAITSQNTLGVQGVMPIPADVVRSQLRSVLDDLNVSAIKIGMLPDVAVAEAVTHTLLEYYPHQRPYIVLDPIMLSTSGTRLMSPDCIDYVRTNLFPLCTLVTPNLPESQLLPPPYPTSFLIKGGHAEGADMTDTLYTTDGKTYTYSSPRITSTNLHGTGCTLSSAIASYLALGASLPEAVRQAKEYITLAIHAGKDQHIGNGNGPLGIPKNV